MKKNIINYALVLALVMLAACGKPAQNDNSDNSELAAAKDIFTRFEALPNAEKVQNLDMLDSCINFLDITLKADPNNASANYFMGYALEKKENGGTNVLNFDLVSVEKTKKISQYFEKSALDKKYVPEYKQSQYSKITSIWSNLALNYLLKGSPDSAAWAIQHAEKVGGFRPANLEYAENVFANLEPNAILITDSEAETVYFRYLQYIKALRGDVSVIDYSMFDYQWYAKWIGFPVNFTRPVETFLTDEMLFNIYSDPNKTESTPEKSIAGIKVKIQGHGKSSNGEILFSVNDRITMQILDKNFAARPIFFTINAAQKIPFSLGLGKNIRLCGLVAKMTNNEITLAESVDGSQIYDLIMNKFQFSKITSPDARQDRDYMFFADKYRFMFSQVLTCFNEYDKDKTRAKAITDKVRELFPEKK